MILVSKIALQVFKQVCVVLLVVQEMADQGSLLVVLQHRKYEVLDSEATVFKPCGEKVLQLLAKLLLNLVFRIFFQMN